MRKNKLNVGQFLLILAFSVSSYFFLPYFIPVVNSSPNGLAKPLHFYLHNETSNPWVGGYTQTTAILNTTQKWRENPQGYENITGRLYLDFYVHPDLASNMSLDGTIWLHPWMCGYGTGGSTIGGVFSAIVYEVTSTGQTLVGSTESTGSQTLPFGSTPADSRDVNSVAGNEPLILHFPAHTFRKGSSILIHIEVNPQGAGAKMFFYYDHSITPSYVTLYSYDYVNVSAVWTANATGYPETVFKRVGDSSAIQINTNVTDPLGGYDFNVSSIGTKDAMVIVTVVDPAGVSVVNNERMTLIDGGITSFVNFLQYNWTFSTAVPGQYNVTISATDNSGNTVNGTAFFWIGQTYQIQIKAIDSKVRPLANAWITASVGEYVALSDYTNTTGWIDAQIVGGTYNLTATWQGVVVNSTLNFLVDTNTTMVLNCEVYDPSFLFVDDVDSPLPEAQVFIESPNGTKSTLPLYTALNGFVNLAQAPAGDYGFTLYWKGVEVLQAIQSVSSDGPYTIKCEVYQLVVEVLGNNGAPVHGAYVIVYTEAGIVYDFKMTDATGKAITKLPVGMYKIEVEYSTTYWLTGVTANATEPLKEVTSSGSVTVTLTDFPPSLWTTVGFWLLVAVIIVIVLGAIGLLYKRGVIFKEKVPKT